jgi:hypothetical protein
LVVFVDKGCDEMDTVDLMVIKLCTGMIFLGRWKRREEPKRIISEIFTDGRSAELTSSSLVLERFETNLNENC